MKMLTLTPKKNGVAGMYGDDDFDAFDRLMKRVMPRRVNAAYSRASVKNISQTLFNKPFVRWHYDPGLMKRREPYDAWWRSWSG